MPDVLKGSDSSLVALSAQVIREGSKSFALASLLFSPGRREAAALLYHWCRTCDDAVDRAATSAERHARVDELIRLTERAYRAESAAAEPLPPAFEALRAVVLRYGVPIRYALDLLEAMRADAEGRRYRTFSELVYYCYGAAGTVGLMMAHVMGVSDERALRHAMDLGISMQLVNISRDVAEDVTLGRVYLPLQWLEESGVPVERLLEPAHREAVFGVVRRLIREADAYRASGESGIRFLSFRSALAVRAASRVYWEIARRVERGGAAGLERRAVVPLATKLRLSAGAIAAELLRLPTRLISPWKAAPIRGIFQFGDPS